MSSYARLAPFYDGLTRDVDYGAFLRFYEQVFAAYGKRPSSVLDLACGTGTLTCLMAERGYDMIGADASPDMLSVAIQKSWELPAENRPLFLAQSMQTLDLYGTVEAAVCSLDGVNYLAPAELDETLRRLRLFVEPGGLFLFDVNSEEKLRALDGQIFLDETEDVYCVWRAELDASGAFLRYGMDLFCREGELWTREFEEHREYLYSVEELRSHLSDAGFGEIRVFGDKKLSPPENGEGRIFLAAKNLRVL